jgi:protein-tyrosine phosphatase
VKLPVFADLHTHLLPGVDDGPASLAGAVEMLRLAHGRGTRSLAATPHMFSPFFDLVDPVAVQDAFAQLLESLKDLGEQPDYGFLKELEIHPGAENYVSPEFLAAVGDHQVVSLNSSRYLLVEFPPFLSFDMAVSAVARILDKGYRPVLAHVERYVFVGRHESGLASLRQMGCVVQINGDSIAARLGRATARRIWSLFDNGLVDVVASDGHDVHGRPIELLTAFSVLAERFATRAIETWMWENPTRILQDREVVAARAR